jgi:putative FmdB family regulatory protein
VPIYEYEVIDGGCEACGGRFELRRPVGRQPLIQCPLCKKAVRKVISGANLPRLAKPLSVADAKQAGFSVFEKREKGVYEKL